MIIHKNNKNKWEKIKRYVVVIEKVKNTLKEHILPLKMYVDME